MFEKIVLIITLLIISLIGIVVIRSILKKQSIFGQAPIPLFYFILAKIFVFICLLFLSFWSFGLTFQHIYTLKAFWKVLSLIFLSTGAIVLVITTIQLNSDLIFGLSSSKKHNLQTNGIYRVSRHPFYLGFLLILFSSCILCPHLLNFLSCIGAWIIHHFIMIKEEEHLSSIYGNEYIVYKNKVNRYLTLN